MTDRSKMPAAQVDSNSSDPTQIRLGISTCPNDTFAFHALIHRLVDWQGLEFQIELLEISQP